ncbi:putative oxidoreductase [Neorhizobium huautlense]|uniref:Oxidoreductase n=1 Tax=Neorhizobium huautlense TaxID=67774 RepID=A0ABT9PQE6_9HYPH|nr:DoxX family protein [Neorhizobium huautlense]MDP9836695.1 putative oxidoreductase [Neorhizobium huautlense]
MQFFDRLGAYRPQALAVLRIMAALLFIEHGTMKLFGFPAAMGDGALPPLMLIAALLEIIGGALLVIGLLTRPVAFILAGQMAVAYFMAHASKGFWPALNGGEPAILFCFIFLYLVCAGPGAWAVDKR